MRNVVEAALRKDESIPTSDAEPNPVREATSELALKRPNYQRAKQNRRLNAGLSGGSKGGTERNSTSSRSNSKFMENSLSPLLRLTLNQGQDDEIRNEAKGNAIFVPGQEADYAAEETSASGMIGRLEGPLRFWLYPELNPKLASEFGIFSSQPVTVGAVAVENGLPGLLFELDELLPRASNLEIDVRKQGARDGVSAIYLIGKREGDSAAVRSLLERWFEKRKVCECSGSVQIYETAYPSALLVKHLGVTADEGVVVVEGIDRFRSVALLDRCMKQMAEAGFRHKIEDRYLLIAGPSASIQRASEALRREVAPYTPPFI
ncbi:hypothetical protein [Cohnella sp. AR92]|uniref:hypothetical protein n=1 Tax=Cohnella sp. AR92 TaxID=648716 RepID=UPI000F8DC07F|nr:hypothetical protein [Cohnella sp. AR92]RUS47073.1 hypothetical protein ELR57_11785 [Cohnella sp. AR92]